MKTKCLAKIDSTELKRVLLHVPCGLIFWALLYVAWPAAILWLLGFFVYELNQDWHISDDAFKDIKGALYGLGIPGVVLFVLKLLEVI